MKTEVEDVFGLIKFCVVKDFVKGLNFAKKKCHSGPIMSFSLRSTSTHSSCNTIRWPKCKFFAMPAGLFIKSHLQCIVSLTLRDDDDAKIFRFFLCPPKLRLLLLLLLRPLRCDHPQLPLLHSVLGGYSVRSTNKQPLFGFGLHTTLTKFILRTTENV